MQHATGYTRLLVAMLAVATLACSAISKSGSLDEARSAARNGDWITAMQMTQAVLRGDPSNADGHALTGDYHWANGDSVKAAESYEKALKNNPKQPGALINLTQYYVQEQRFPDAERIIAAAESKDPKGKVDEIAAARGMLSAAQGNFAEATKLLVNLATKRPDNPLYPILLARLYNGKGVKEQANQYYADAWKLNPGDMDLAYEYALVLQDLQDYDRALEVMKVVQDKNQDNKTVDYMIGRLYYAAGQWGEAARNLQMAVDKRPDHFLSQYLLGKATVEYSKAERKNLYRNAEMPLRVAHDLRPERADVLVSLNELLEIQGRLNLQFALADTVAARTAAFCDTALIYFRELAVNDPAYKGIHANMAKVWAKLGNLDSTIVHCQLELERNPEDATSLSRLVNAQQRKKDYAGLTATLRPVYDRLDWSAAAPDSGQADPRADFISRYASVLANALQETGQTQVEREILQGLLRHDPRWKDGHVLNAMVDLRRNNYGGAILVLEPAVEALPRDGDLWVMLGDSYYFSNPKHKPTVLKAKDCYLKASQLGNRDGREKFNQLAAIK